MPGATTGLRAEQAKMRERMRALVPELRATFKNPNSFRHLETVGNAYIKYMEAQGPEAYPAFQAMVAGMAAGKQA